MVLVSNEPRHVIVLPSNNERGHRTGGMKALEQISERLPNLPDDVITGLQDQRVDYPAVNSGLLGTGLDTREPIGSYSVSMVLCTFADIMMTGIRV
jgi:hypothetical protein